jgi:rRNA biogenesis protein RRP5
LGSIANGSDVETVEKMAVLEFKHGEAERGKTLFEGLVDRYPRRLDLWSVYIDQLAKTDIQGVRYVAPQLFFYLIRNTFPC